MADATGSASLASAPEGYGEWFADLKQQVRAAQQRAALAVNTEQLRLYWRIGRRILDKQGAEGYGTRVIARLSADLRGAFPEMKGFSERNLKYMRKFADAWPDLEVVQQPVAQLPWGHNVVLLDRFDSMAQRLAYARAALQHGWSRNVLVMHIEAGTVERTGRALNNFDRTLPPAQSDLAREALKDPYKLDFLGLGKDAEERAIEQALVDHVASFLVELGAGFAYVGRQVPLHVGDEDFYLDLLFYHLTLRCYLVIELKATKFKPEHLGQLGFYCAAIDGELKHEDDAPTLGMLLCQAKDGVVAEYALRGSAGPLGIAEYELLKDLPEPLATNLPTIEQIERELSAAATLRPGPAS